MIGKRQSRVICMTFLVDLPCKCENIKEPGIIYLDMAIDHFEISTLLELIVHLFYSSS